MEGSSSSIPAPKRRRTDLQEDTSPAAQRYKRIVDCIPLQYRARLSKEICSDQHICQVAETLIGWERKANLFELSYNPDVNDILAKFRYQPRQRIEVLRRWKARPGTKTYGDLLLICLKGEMMDSAKVILSLLSDPDQTFPSNTSTISYTISDYAEGLKCSFRSADMCNNSKWPPTPSKKFIRLVLIEHRRGIEESLHVDQIMEGDVGKLLQGRQEVCVENVLELVDDDKFGLVLVEGAPGIGKSTLSWELCRNWGTFACMEKYSIVLLLRLRDRDIQNIREAAGLFDGEEDVAKEIKRGLGKGVLFILDGFDELPIELQTEGFLAKELISGKAFPKSTVLVTSRPSTTAIFLTSYGPFLKKRMEVLGFTQEQVEEYADSVFQDSKVLSEFLTYISASPINSLMYVPFNAAIVVALYKDRSADSGPMPSTMTELYIELCRTLLKRYLDCTGQPKLNLKDFKSLPKGQYKEFLALCKIAYVGIADRRVIFHDLDSIKHFGFLNAVPSLRGRCRISYNFSHLTVQEFLAAYHISQLSDEDKQDIAEQQKDAVHWNIVWRFIAGLTKSVPEFNPLKLTSEIIMCLYEAQFCADPISLFGRECRLGGVVRQHLHAYALGHCIANSKASWRPIKIEGARVLDSFVWGVRSTKLPCGGVLTKLHVRVHEGEQLATDPFKDAPLSGLSQLHCLGSIFDCGILDRISQAIPVMTRLKELDIDIGALKYNYLKLSRLFLQLVSSNVKKLSLTLVTPELPADQDNEESLQKFCSALRQLIDPSFSGNLVELKLSIVSNTASKLLNIIFAPSSLRTVTLYLDDDEVPSLALPATCTNTNITKLRYRGRDVPSEVQFAIPQLTPVPVVVHLVERNNALQELTIENPGLVDESSFFYFCYHVLKGIPTNTSLELVKIYSYRLFINLKIKCREDVEDLCGCAYTKSADTFIKLATERGIWTKMTFEA